MFEVVNCLGTVCTVFGIFTDDESNIRFLIYDYVSHKWETIYASSVRPINDKNDRTNQF